MQEERGHDAEEERKALVVRRRHERNQNRAQSTGIARSVAPAHPPHRGVAGDEAVSQGVVRRPAL